MSNLTLDEMETCINMNGSNRNVWDIYSDDPVLQKRLEKAGAQLTRDTKTGGKYYTLPADQIRFRSEKKPLSEAQKAQLANARARRAGNSGDSEA